MNPKSMVHGRLLKCQDKIFWLPIVTVGLQISGHEFLKCKPHILYAMYVSGYVHAVYDQWLTLTNSQSGVSNMYGNVIPAKQIYNSADVLFLHEW